jgi:hypothetical protein
MLALVAAALPANIKCKNVFCPLDPRFNAKATKILHVSILPFANTLSAEEGRYKTRRRLEICRPRAVLLQLTDKASFGDNKKTTKFLQQRHVYIP